MQIADLEHTLLELAARELVPNAGFSEQRGQPHGAVAVGVSIEALDRGEVEQPLVLGFGDDALQRSA